MPNTLVSSCTDLSYMQPSQDVMMAFPVFHKRHGAIIHTSCAKLRRNVFAPLWRTDVFEPASFSILKRRWRSAGISFLALWKALRLQWSTEANALPGIRTSPIIGHVTAGLLSVTACTFLSGMEGGGGMWGASKAEKKGWLHSVPALVWGPTDVDRLTP